MAIYQGIAATPDFLASRYVEREELPWSSALNREDVILEFGAQRLNEIRYGDVVVGVGYRFEKEVCLDAVAIRQFADFFDDRNPVHHDAEFASSTRFGAIIACGPHTLALFTAMVATHFSAFTPMLGLEFGYRFLRAVKAEDRLVMGWEVTALERKPSLDGVVVNLEGETMNQNGEEVLAGSGTVLLTQRL